MRGLIKQVDDEEMTFLMHAVSGGSTSITSRAPGASTWGARSAAPSRVPAARQRRQTHPQGSDVDGGDGDGQEAEDRGDASDGGDAAEVGGVRPSVPTSVPPARGAMDPGLVVFKTAWWLVQEMLWKEQVR